MTGMSAFPARVRLVAIALFAGLLLALLQPMSAQAAHDASLIVKLTSKAGAALTGVNVSAIRLAPDSHEKVFGDLAEPATSLGGGRYQLELYSGEQYALYFDAPASTTTSFDQYYGGATLLDEADYVSIVPGSQSLDVSLATNATFTGTVKSTSKKAIAGAQVIPWIWKGGTDFVRLADRAATTSSSGAYSLRNLEPGSYRLEYSVGNTTPYVTGFSGDALNIEDATGYALGLGQTMTVNGALRAGATISGTIALQDGALPQGITATAYRLTNVPARTIDPSTAFFSAPTTSNGKWTIKGLRYGDYVVRFTDHDELYATRWSVDHVSRLDSNVVSLTSGLQATVPTTTLQLVDDPATDTRVTMSLLSPSSTPTTGDVLIVSGGSDGGGYSRIFHVPTGGVTLKSIPAGTYDLYVDPDEAGFGGYTQTNFVVSPAAGADDFSAVLPVESGFDYTVEPSVAASGNTIDTTYIVNPGSVSLVTAPVSNTYQWYRGGIPIKGATTLQYTSAGVDVGFALSVAVRTERYGYAPLFKLISLPTIVAGAAPNALVLPEIDDEGTYPGDLLRVDLGSWDVGHLDFSYQWFANAVQVGTGATYKLAPADAGKTITLNVTGSGAGRPPGTEVASNSVPVDYLAPPVMTKLPKVSLTRAGLTNATRYTASGGTWSPTADSYGYEWLVDDVSQGVANTFECPDSLCTPSSIVQVAVVAFKTGYDAGGVRVVAKKTNVQATQVGPGYATTPSVPGGLGTDVPVAVGSVVTAHPEVLYDHGLFGVTFTAAYKWQTSSNGTTWSAVAGKTAATLTLPASIVGKRLRVVITTTSNAFPTHIENVPVGTVKKKLDLVTAPATFSVDGSGVSGVNVQVYATTAWPLPSVTQTYHWYICDREHLGSTCDDHSAVGGLTNWQTAPGVSTGLRYRLPTTNESLSVLAVVTGSKSGYESQSVISGIFTPTVPSGAPYPLSYPTVAGTVAGNAAVGTKLTASGTVWDDPLTEVTRGWQYCPTGSDCLNSGVNDPDWVSISGEFAATYTPTAGILAVGTAIRYAEAGTHGGTNPAYSASMPLVAGTNKATTAPSISYNTTTHLATANPGVWGAGSTFTYAWSDASGPLGDIGATATSTSAPFWVDIVVSRPGYNPADVRLIAKKYDPAVLGGPITGGNTFGDTLDVDQVGMFGFTISATLTFKYQWYSGTKAIPGATGETYTPTAAYVGKAIKVKVTESAPFYVTKTAFSSPITLQMHPAPVGSVAMNSTPGGFAPGATLDAVKTGLPSGAIYTYKWQRFVNSVWTTVGTKSTYVIQPGDAGYDMQVVVVAKKPGWATSAEIVSPSETIQPINQIRPVGAFSIGASARVGVKITVSGTWDAPGVTNEYTWYVDGAALPGVTGPSWTPPASAYAAAVYVEVDGNVPGYYGNSEDTNELTIGLGIAPTASTKPSISGMTGSGSPKAPRDGNTLSTTTGAWTVDGLTFSYQWTLDGTDIPGATDNVYLVQPGDVAQVIAVRVKGAKTGWNTGTATSANTKVVQP